MFSKPLGVGVPGGRKRYVCPECKSADVRLNIPDGIGMGAKWKVKITVEEVKDGE